MNEIWERVLANSFSGIHKSKIICSVEAVRVLLESMRVITEAVRKIIEAVRLFVEVGRVIVEAVRVLRSLAIQ